MGTQFKCLHDSKIYWNATSYALLRKLTPLKFSLTELFNGKEKPIIYSCTCVHLHKFNNQFPTLANYLLFYIIIGKRSKYFGKQGNFIASIPKNSIALIQLVYSLWKKSWTSPINILVKGANPSTNVISKTSLPLSILVKGANPATLV